MEQIGTLLIPGDIGAEWGYEQAAEVARQLEQRLNQPVALCFPEEDFLAPFAAAVQSLVEAGRTRLVIVPLGLCPVSERGRIAQSIVWAKHEWPDLGFHVATPLTWLEWSGWLRLTALDAVNKLALRPAEAAVLLVGQGGASPLENANLARLAHLVQESSPQASVSYAFVGGMRPAIPEAIRRLACGGLHNVVVVPWLLDEDHLKNRLADELQQAAQPHDFRVTLTLPSLAHAALINVLVSNHYAALSDRYQLREDADAQLQSNGGELSKRSPQAGITPVEAFELQELERRINWLLPPEYQGRYETVRAQSMGTAGLKFDEDGKVAWDKIWTSFCDLALAGGPPHRGTLLEAATSEEARAEPEQYQEVVAEIERGIQLVTSLPVVASKTPGWVGVRCENEEMAIWLMRAIIVENVMVRREGDVLYLPAGPRFTVKREIKNVVTAIAKTVHYWTAHLLARRQSQQEY
ncbi:MAG: CbiX/SirB N-terminal domain-containing protein [Planctomycetota bacterium]